MLIASDRRVLAKLLGINEQYLYQVLSGRREPDPLLAVRIEHASKQTIKRWELRPSDWHRIWPELVGVEGAPSLALTAGGTC